MELLVRTVDGENALRYQAGDIVTVRPDGHLWGRMESKDVWEEEGNRPEDWPGNFCVLKVPGVPEAAAATWTAEGGDLRRGQGIHPVIFYAKLGSGDQAKFLTGGTITCSLADISASLATRTAVRAKAKG